MTLGQLSDSAYWMAYVRAVEAERPDALFRDPYSRQLAGHLGEAISRRMGSFEMILSSIAVRTAVLDWLILDMVERLEVNLILNIGSGLDTRPWRLALPENLSWVDVDLPTVLYHKTQTLAKHPTYCRYRSIGLDVLHSAQRQRGLRECGESDRVMVVTEGLLVYLRASEVEDLARDLHSETSCQWWLTDLVGPLALERLRHEWASKMGNVQFQFGPADSVRFFGQLGWREAEFHSSSQDARRLGRAPPLPWLARLLMSLSARSDREQYRRLAGISVLTRDTLPGQSS